MSTYSKPHRSIKVAHERMLRVMEKARSSMADVPIGYKGVDPRTYEKYRGLANEDKLFELQRAIRKNKKESEVEGVTDYDDRQRPGSDYNRANVGIGPGASQGISDTDGPIIFGPD